MPTTETTAATETTPTPTPTPTVCVPDPQVVSLLDFFSCRELGDGDIIAGMNTLVAMCGSLATVAGPHANLRGESGRTLELGFNSLTSGNFSCEMLQRRVLDPLSMNRNLVRTNSEILRKAVDDAERPPMPGEPRGWTKSNRPLSALVANVEFKSPRVLAHFTPLTFPSLAGKGP